MRKPPPNPQNPALPQPTRPPASNPAAVATLFRFALLTTADATTAARLTLDAPSHNPPNTLCSEDDLLRAINAVARTTCAPEHHQALDPLALTHRDHDLDVAVAAMPRLQRACLWLWAELDLDADRIAHTLTIAPQHARDLIESALDHSAATADAAASADAFQRLLTARPDRSPPAKPPANPSDQPSTPPHPPHPPAAPSIPA